MPATDTRVDAYIAAAPDFAKPILVHLRRIIHAGCPDVVETMKWSTPFFDYQGTMCSVAAFKAHCTLRFWKGDLVLPEADRKRDGLARFSRITNVKELPSTRALTAMVARAAQLNADGVAAPWLETRARKRAVRAVQPVVVPADLAAALKKNSRANAAFKAFSPSHRREYIEWIEGAKREETRARRLKLALEQIAEGKSQNWRYAKA